MIKSIIIFAIFMEKFKIFTTQLENRLKNGKLPGLKAQMIMVPVTRLEELKSKIFADPPKKSAVLILFYPDKGKIKLIMIKRPKDNSVHSGQIAFPGGSFEKSDKKLSQTALREASEEVHVDPAKVTLIGHLSNIHINPSNFDVTPFVGYTSSRPDLHGNNEVDKILEIGLDELLDPGKITQKVIRNSEEKKYSVPCFYIQNEIIWGASAMMLAELIAIIREI
ncbi:MAG: CoA pyrophosphatase [Chlorobi bacterium]|nr:CoA pyrophosphatase [Chlorobiota bacterium]